MNKTFQPDSRSKKSSIVLKRPTDSLIPLFDLNYDEKEIASVTKVIRTKWISMGSVTKTFEEKFASFIGTRYGVAVNSCTAALHLSMLVLDIHEGDEVIVPSLTFVATVNAVKYAGATPVFADVTSLNDWTISPADIKKKITPRTKAIVVMHYGGFSSNIDEIKDISSRKGIPIVEDACHAPGGIHCGKRVGTQGDLACYSFYSNKHISIGEGGMLLTNNEQYAKRARFLRTHGMNLIAYDRKKTATMYDVLEIGYNYRLDDIHASLGIIQLKKLKKSIKQRNLIASLYRKILADTDRIFIPFTNYDGLSSYYIFPILLEGINRNSVMETLLNKYRIQTSYHYPPVHKFSCYMSENTPPLPLTEKITSSCLSLPMYDNLTVDDVDYISKSLIETVGTIGKNVIKGRFVRKQTVKRACKEICVNGREEEY